MKTLVDFLATADLDNAIALQQAQVYEGVQGRFITSNTLTVYVVQLGLYSLFVDASNTMDHAARDMCMAVVDRLRGVSDFNFIVGSPMGDANFALLAGLKQALPDSLAQLDQLQAVVTGYCNPSVAPFINTTLHDVLLLRKQCPESSVVIEGNYAVITTTADCEKHSPQLLAVNPRTNKKQRINNFYGVELAGKYDCAIPPEFNGWQLSVDNAYGVM